MKRWIIGLIFLVAMVSSIFAAPVYMAQEVDIRYGPYIDRITFTVQRDYNLRLLAFEAGEFDLVGVLPKDLDRIRKNRPDAHIIFTAGFTALGTIHFNVQNWPVKYLEVRQALAHLINRDKMIAESPLQGIAIKNSFIVPPTQGVWVNREADFEKIYPYDREKARELLDRVFDPCPDDPNSWCDPNEGMKKVEIELLTLPEATSPTFWWFAQYLKSEAEAIGLSIKIVPVSSRELDARTASGTAQAWIIGWLLGRFPLFMYYFWHSSQIRPGGWNEWRVSDPRVDELLDKFYYAETIEEAQKYALEVQKILVEEIVPWIPVYTGIGITALSGELDRDTLVLNYAPPLKDPVGFNHFWWSNIRFKDKPFGGTIRYYNTVDLTTLHPAIYLWATESQIISRIYTFGYVTRAENIYAEPRLPVLFESYSIEKVEEDGKTLTKVTLVVREGVKWHDGVPLTAEDIEFTIRKFGMELKTRRYYGPDIEAIVRMEVVDERTIEIYLSAFGWIDLYGFTEFRVLPKHIFERLENPLDDPSFIPHPTKPGLTAMIGSGPFFLAKREIGYTEVVWYPEYVFRVPERTVQIEVLEAPSAVDAGTPFTVRVQLTDYLGNPATNASATLVVSGPRTVEVPMTHTGGGVFEASIPALDAGQYTVTVKASMPIMLWQLTNEKSFTLSVGEVAVAPTPGPVEAKPITVEVAGVQVEIQPPPQVEEVSPTPPSIEAVEVKAPETAFDATSTTMAMVIAVIGLVVAAVARFVRR